VISSPVYNQKCERVWTLPTANPHSTRRRQLRHIAGTAGSTKRYLNIELLKDQQMERCHHRVSQGRPPSAKPKVRKILDTPRHVILRAVGYNFRLALRLAEELFTPRSSR
jgi:hypothetical protein